MATRQALRKLLNYTHVNDSILYHNRTFHLHAPHHIGSMYFLGASEARMKEVYQKEARTYERYEESPGSIDKSNWKKHLGDRLYCKAYREFFDRELKVDQTGESTADWKQTTLEYLLEPIHDNSRLFNSLACGLAHPVIHLGYAFELEAPTVASEALAMACVCRNSLSDVMDSLSVPSGSKTSLELIQLLQQESSLPLFAEPGPDNIMKLIENKAYLKKLMDIYSQWAANRKSPAEILKEIFDTNTLVFAASHKKEDPQFDFFLLHLVTASNAARILHKVLDDNLKHSLHCQLFFFSLIIYLCQQKPIIDKNLVLSYKGTGEHTWNYVIDKAINTAQAEDSHLVKVIRSLRDASNFFGDKDNIYLNSAVKLINTMEHMGNNVNWVGFS